MITELRPLAYGYMRMPCDVEDHVIRDMELKLRHRAEGEGYEFAAIFHEFRPASYLAWDELTTELQRADVHHVFVPSIRHLARNRIIQSSLLDRLDKDAKAEVHTPIDRVRRIGSG